MQSSSRIKIIAYIIAILVIFSFGISGTYIIGHYGNGFNIRINNLVDAVYFTTITLSTIGYGDIYPVTSIAKIFVMVLIISGLGVFLSAVTVISSEFVNSRVEKISGRIGRFDRLGLRNHVVLVGSDTVNMLLAQKLKSKGTKFIMLTSATDEYDKLIDLGYRAYLTDATEEEQMKKFEFDKAKSIIVDMHDKSRMIYAILILRNLAAKSKIVTVAHTKEEEKNVRSLTAGVGVINPEDIASDILSRKISEL